MFAFGEFIEWLTKSRDRKRWGILIIGYVVAQQHDYNNAKGVDVV